MNIYNVIILDESGSMSCIRKETIQSMNEVLNGIRMNQKEFSNQQHYVTFVTFEGQGADGVKMRRDRVPIDKIANITERDYRPGGCTPLYDAIGVTLNDLESKINSGDKVMATIITDGYENASTEYSGRIIKNLMSRLREKGWTFAYIGANQDSVEVARDLHIDNALDFDETPEGIEKMSHLYCTASRKVSLMYDLMGEDECVPCTGIFNEPEDQKD